MIKSTKLFLTRKFIIVSEKETRLKKITKSYKEFIFWTLLVVFYAQLNLFLIIIEKEFHTNSKIHS